MLCCQAFRCSPSRHWPAAATAIARTQFCGTSPARPTHQQFRRRRLSERNKTFALFVMTPTRLVWPLLLVHLSVALRLKVVFSIARRDARIWREIYGPVFFLYTLSETTCAYSEELYSELRSVTLVDYLRTFIATPRKLSMLWSYGWPKLESPQ